MTKTNSEKNSARSFRPGTRLDPKTGHEQSRTGKTTSKRDIQPRARPDEEGGRSQNASGGRTNR
jgi:hypothetical protein